MKRVTVKGMPGLLVQGDVMAGPLVLPSTPGVSEDGQVLAWDNTAGEFAWTSAGGGGGGAPTTADYLVRTADAGLSAERVVTDTSWISVDWGTAGQAKFNLADAGLVSLASADAAAGLPYVSGASTWTSLALAADKGIYATGTGALATYDLTSFARTLLDDTTAAAARTTLGIGTAGRGVVATAQAISAGSTYELVTRQGARYLALKRRTTFPVARSVAAASPEYGWTWLNRTALDSADENTTASNEFYFDHGATSTDWWTTVQSAPARYRTYPLPPGRTYVITARIRCNADANYEFAFLQAWSPTSPNNWTRIGPGWNAGPTPIIAGNTYGTTGSQVAITTGQRDAGVWVRMYIRRGLIDLYYSTSSSSTPPTSWSFLREGAGINVSGVDATAINIGQVMQTVNTSNTFTGAFMYWDVQWTDDVDALATDWSGLLWPATQFDSTGAEQLIVDDLDLGSDAPTVDNTRLRAILADLENRLQGDSATITWSYKTGASTGATSGTYRAAGSVVDDGAGGRYLRLWAKITSDGNTAGSIGPFPFFIPTS